MKHLSLLLALALLAAGCDCDCKPKQYRLNDGTVVECKGAAIWECGMKLYDCTNGITYRCQTNVQELPQREFKGK
jgi:hypothetical protein